jgi:hypothetical protein
MTKYRTGIPIFQRGGYEPNPPAPRCLQIHNPQSAIHTPQAAITNANHHSPAPPKSDDTPFMLLSKSIKIPSFDSRPENGAMRWL